MGKARLNTTVRERRVQPPRAARREIAKASRNVDKSLRKIETDNVALISKEMVNFLQHEDKVIEELDEDQYQEMFDDAKVIGKFAQGSAKLSTTLEVVEKSFQVGVFARNLNDMFKSSEDRRKTEFLVIGSENGIMIRNPVTGQFAELWPTQDALNRPVPSPYKETAVRKPRRRIDMNTNATNPNMITDAAAAAKAGVDETVQEVEKMRSRLNKLYARNDKKPVCYVKWVYDRDSFPKTVENVFHAMFLCKEGTIKLDQDQNGNACVEPSTPSLRSGDEREAASINKQAIFKLDYPKWRSWGELH